MSSSQAVNTHMVVLDTGFRRRCSAALVGTLLVINKRTETLRGKSFWMNFIHPSSLCILDTKTDKRPPRTL